MMLRKLKACVSCRSFRRAWPSKSTVLSVIGLFCLGGIALATGPDPSKDMLSGAFADVNTNFGPSSNFALIVYAVEIVAGVAAYVKTKNLLSLAGLLVVITFTAFAFGMIAPTA